MLKLKLNDNEANNLNKCSFNNKITKFIAGKRCECCLCMRGDLNGKLEIFSLSSSPLSVKFSTNTEVNNSISSTNNNNHSYEKVNKSFEFEPV